MKTYVILLCVYLALFTDDIAGLKRKRQRHKESILEHTDEIASKTVPNIDIESIGVGEDTPSNSFDRERRGGDCDLCGEQYGESACDNCAGTSGCVDTCETCAVCTGTVVESGVTKMILDTTQCTGSKLEYGGIVSSNRKLKNNDVDYDIPTTNWKIGLDDGDDYIIIDKHDVAFKKNCGYQRNKNNANKVEIGTCRQKILLSSCKPAPKCADAGCDFGYKSGISDSTDCADGNCGRECCADQPTCSSTKCNYGYKYLKSDATLCTDCAVECCAPQPECASAGCKHGYANNKDASTKCTNCEEECCASQPTCSTAGCSFGYKAGKDDSTLCTTCGAECCAVPPTCSSVSCQHGYRTNKNADSICTEPICGFECCEPPTCAMAQGLAGHECKVGSVYDGAQDAKKCEFPRNFNTVCCKPGPCTTGDADQVLEIYPSCVVDVSR